MPVTSTPTTCRLVRRQNQMPWPRFFRAPNRGSRRLGPIAIAGRIAGGCCRRLRRAEAPRRRLRTFASAIVLLWRAANVLGLCFLNGLRQLAF